MVSDKCRSILSREPPCNSKRELMRWIMCYSRAKIEEGYSYKNAMKEAWDKAKSSCRLGKSK